ncbi:hypothetical protein AMECASPLE_032018 [Ameca splendens]|uniref:Uncharacterized protein n=1 Tax=Ameca splendens TaxID=208324 RepID=A0ABV0XVC2_9TELE
MHTTTRINTTFEQVEVGLESFHTPFAVCRLGSEAGRGSGPPGRDLGWVWGSGLGGCLVLGLAFLLFWDCLDFLGSQSLALVAGPLLGIGARLRRQGLGRAVCSVD